MLLFVSPLIEPDEMPSSFHYHDFLSWTCNPFLSCESSICDTCSSHDSQLIRCLLSSVLQFCIISDVIRFNVLCSTKFDLNNAYILFMENLVKVWLHVCATSSLL